jgi:Protein of unknown function (DUF2750).
MRYEPHPDEIAAIPNMSDEELLEYFLYRIFETDEVWGLKSGSQWLTRQWHDLETLLVWPYKRYADDAANHDWTNAKPIAESIETFTYRILNNAHKTGQVIEIMPRAGTAVGCLIKPQQLFAMLDNMMEARESNVGE